MAKKPSMLQWIRRSATMVSVLLVVCVVLFGVYWGVRMLGREGMTAEQQCNATTDEHWVRAQGGSASLLCGNSQLNRHDSTPQARASRRCVT